MGTTATKTSRTESGSNGRADMAEAQQDVAAQVDALKSDIAGLAAAIQSLTAAGADVATDTAKTKLAAANDAGDAALREVIGKATDGSAAIADYAREKPLVALAAAAGAGLLIGYLTAPRK